MSCQVQTSSHGACCPSALAVLFSRSVFSQAGRPARGLVAADRWEQAFEALLAPSDSKLGIEAHLKTLISNAVLKIQS